jgi:hypothetical protein
MMHKKSFVKLGSIFPWLVMICLLFSLQLNLKMKMRLGNQLNECKKYLLMICVMFTTNSLLPYIHQVHKRNRCVLYYKFHLTPLLDIKNVVCDVKLNVVSHFIIQWSEKRRIYRFSILATHVSFTVSLSSVLELWLTGQSWVPWHIL